MQIDWAALTWLTLGGYAGAVVRPQTAEFQVEGAETAYKLPPVSAILRLGVWFELLSTKHFF